MVRKREALFAHIARVLKIEVRLVRNLLRSFHEVTAQPKPTRRIKRWHAAARVLNELGHGHARIAFLIGADRRAVIAHLRRIGRLRRKPRPRPQWLPPLTSYRRPGRRKKPPRQPWRSYLSKRDRAWMSRFSSEKMPSGRIAFVLDLDAGMVRGYLRDSARAREKPPARAVRTRLGR